MASRVAHSIASCAFALLATVEASSFAAETPATFTPIAPGPALLIGGAFSVLGEPRLALLTAHSGAFHGEAVRVSGVRASVIHGRTCYIAGDFRSVNGQPRAGLARLDLDGHLDPDWHPQVEGSVAALAIAGDALYLGGNFTALDGEPHANLARLTLNAPPKPPAAADGAAANKPGAWQADTDGPVYALVATREAVVVGGAFSNVAGEPHVRLASLAITDGKPLAAFTGGADSDVRALVVRGEQLYLGGLFARIGSEDRHGLARIDLATGSVDAAWHADVEGAVYALSAVWDKLYVGGAFSSINNTPRNNCARLTLATAALEPWSAEPDGQVTALAEPDGGRILLGGRFTSVGDSPAAGLVAVSADDGKPLAEWRGPALPANDSPTALVLAGDTLCVGSSSVQGRSGSGLAWLTATGALDARSTVLDGSRPRVMCAVTHQGKLYIGGDFTMLDGQPRVNLARIDLVSGELDRRWHCDANGPVRTLAVSGDTLLVGGDFTQLGASARRHLGQLALADAAVQPLQADLDGTLMALLPTPQGLLIAGNFSHVGTAARYGLARLHGADGSLDDGFMGDVMDGVNVGTVHALLRLDPERIAIAGRFTSVNGAAAGNLALLQPASGTIAPWALADGPVFTMALAHGRLAVGGGFTTIAGAPRGRVAQLDPRTGNATAWRADADAEVRSLAGVGDDLWLAGDFSTLAGRSALHLARCTWSDGTARPATGSDERIELVFPLTTTP